MKCPCYKCERRQVGCHSKCDDYKEYRACLNEGLDTMHEYKEYSRMSGRRWTSYEAKKIIYGGKKK